MTRVSTAINVTSEQSTRFIESIEEVIRKLGHDELAGIYLLHYQHQAIVISYDGEYKPFIGFTRGYNQPNQRAYLWNCELLQEIGEILKMHLENIDRPSHGGRVFINSKIVIHDGNPICAFSWSGEDIFDRCKCILSLYRDFSR